jgi:hypothetical protein
MKLLIAWAVIACCATTSTAALIIDQENTAAISPDINRYLVPNVNNTSVQVVTAGVTGQLVKIELGAFRVLEGAEEPLHVDIASTAGELPDFTPAARLATRTIMPADVPPGGDPSLATFSLVVDFAAANLYFEQGERFAIMLRSDHPMVGYGWWINSPIESTYSGGGAYSLFLPPNPPNGLTQYGDTQFRTFVNAPEPAAFGLGLLALLGVVASNRARR